MPSDTLVVNSTAGDPNANSYCSIAEADAYNATHPYNADWTGLVVGTLTVNDQKARVLITATSLLDELMLWSGWVSTLTQALLWPRNGMLTPSGWDYVGTTVVPQRLKNATAEFARQLIASNRMADSDLETLQIDRVNVGGLAVGFRHPQPKVLPDAVFYMLSLWGRVKSRTSPMVPVFRG